MNSVFVVTSEYNDACNCHPEPVFETIGAFTSELAADAYILNAPNTITVRGIQKSIYYEVKEISIID